MEQPELTVAGIKLQCLRTAYVPNTIYLCEEGSTIYDNVQKLALSISSSQPALIRGPVGSGKTSIVKYLSSLTGRDSELLTVQLGEHTDSRVLLGGYQCSDSLGDFVWKPGVLTKAVVNGHWLLLEDLDLTSSDVITLIESLVRSRTLSVPGFSYNVKQHPDFQLFATLRTRREETLIRDEWKNWCVIDMKPLSENELTQMITKKYSKLTTIAPKMSKVLTVTLELTPPTCRTPSPRDLFKWCDRANRVFKSGDQNSSLKIYSDACAVFCSSYNQDLKQFLCEKIGAVLGIVKNQTDFLSLTYKPVVNVTPHELTVGRTTLTRTKLSDLQICTTNPRPFSFTRSTCRLLEQVVSCLANKEPMLLVGETGCGKTTVLQYITEVLGRKLVVINLNQQSDIADLLGGNKPLDVTSKAIPFWQEFIEMCNTYIPELELLEMCQNLVEKQKWKSLIKIMLGTTQDAISSYSKSLKKEGLSAEEKEELLIIRSKITEMNKKIIDLNEIVKKRNKNLMFSFVEGSLVSAIQKGHWVLLDEINLATGEILDCLCGFLENWKLSILERGDLTPMEANQDFRLFAAMNPATDVGKKQLPFGLRNRFTEIYVEEIRDKSDILPLVETYLRAINLPRPRLEKIVQFYLTVRKQAETILLDGIGKKPHYSLRSLCRALTIAASNPCGDINRSLYEGFCCAFLTQLNNTSYSIVHTMITQAVLPSGCQLNQLVGRSLPRPKSQDKYEQFQGYWIRSGGLKTSIDENYILTPTVERHLRDLLRVVSFGQSVPILLQGETSVGKTSMIQYLAKSTGNVCTRVNNNEHTDIQEYLGTYVVNDIGRLTFKEGILCEAMRKGHWLVLDELNLAPTEVLEALNRVLDDNRELFLTETQSVIKAHKNFILFATQNPPGFYGGRKQLSRAFRNRFVELNFDQIPDKELETILEKRCQMPASYTKKMVAVMKELQFRRKDTNVFVGKSGFITMRDLFRWGERYRLANVEAKFYDWDQHLADEGFLLLGGRVRRADQSQIIKDVLMKHFKRKIVETNLFTLNENTSIVTKQILQTLQSEKLEAEFQHIVWTYSMRRLAVLVCKALIMNEPVLLVGETGCGKTTVIQVLAKLYNKPLYSVNCHLHSEGADFLGGLRPVREPSERKEGKLFAWYDGPLVTAVKGGSYFLADEISLADDSVLERLNSLLEPERSILLSEKGGTGTTDVLKAAPGFQFVGTMNPGGDYGKKELSPALRNRFTEIWAECNVADLTEIVSANLSLREGEFNVVEAIIEFVNWYRKTEIGRRAAVTIRDLLTWVRFIIESHGHGLSLFESYTHGACLAFLDEVVNSPLWKQAVAFLLRQISMTDRMHIKSQLLRGVRDIHLTEDKFGIHPFYVLRGSPDRIDNSFVFSSPTSCYNTVRLLRGIQLKKAILLEGSPGVGKTSLVAAVSKAAGYKLTRINLSDQTDISDLFGADLPEEGASAGTFVWRDGPLLTALKEGHWIVLDELNLASQSVLEGLNAILDHRGAVFIPELNRTFYLDVTTRIFGCQNPLREGGSRKGLPKSFLNRFTKVFIEAMTSEDYNIILSQMFPTLDSQLIANMVQFNEKLNVEVKGGRCGVRGGPWELNLRDLTRWCEGVVASKTEDSSNISRYMSLLYMSRARTQADKSHIVAIFHQIFPHIQLSDSVTRAYVTNTKVLFGDVELSKENNFVYCESAEFGKYCGESKRANGKHVRVLDGQLDTLAELATCVSNNWLAILVGDSGNGKTSLVHTLANLTGNRLRSIHMNSAIDTTEILGGYEQTDYNRHFEDIVEVLQVVVLSAARAALLEDKKKESSALVENWQQFESTVQKHDTDMREKRAGVKTLIAMDSVKNYPPNKSLIGSIQAQLSELGKKQAVDSKGKFEWVDSVLVKCLKDGSWLVLEDVNLCSSAVLDRLNPVLEPHGVLTVSERGAMNDGSLVTIVPHPNFRLFFTMDPKSGSISRALRNRGVEISLIKKGEVGALSNLDIKVLQSDIGITNPQQQHHLLQTTDKISELVSRTFWAQQYLSHNFTWADTLNKIIPNCELNTVEVSTMESLFQLQQARPDLDEYLVEPSVARSKQSCALVSSIMHLLCSGSHETTVTLNALLGVTYDRSYSYEDILLYLILNISFTCSVIDVTKIQALVSELSDFVNSCTNLDLKNLFKKAEMLLSASLQIVNTSEDASDCPWDKRWLGSNEVDTPFPDDTLLLIKYNYLTTSIEQTKQNEMSLTEYSQRVADGIYYDFIGNWLIANYNKYLSAVDCFMTSTLQSGMDGLSPEHMEQLCSAMRWRFALGSLANEVIIKNKIINADLVAKLNIVASWFIKKFISLLKILFEKDSSLKEVIKYSDIISNSWDTSNLVKISNKFLRLFGHPPACVTESMDVCEVMSSNSKSSINLEILKQISITLGVYVSSCLIRHDVSPSTQRLLVRYQELLELLSSYDGINVKRRLQLCKIFDTDVSTSEMWFHFNKWIQQDPSQFHQAVLTDLVCKALQERQESLKAKNKLKQRNDSDNITNILLLNSCDLVIDDVRRFNIWTIEECKCDFEVNRILKNLMSCFPETLDNSQSLLFFVEDKLKSAVKKHDKLFYERLVAILKHILSIEDETVGIRFILIGLLDLVVLAQGRVDPIFKKIWRHHLAVTEVRDLELELYAHQVSHKVTGFSLKHPYLQILNNNLTTNQRIVDKYSYLKNVTRDCQAFRTFNVDLNYFLDTVMEKTLNICEHTPTTQVIDTLLSINERFISKTETLFLDKFRDVVYPVLAAASQIQTGLIHLRSHLNLTNQDKEAQNFIVKVCQFPSHCLADNYSQDSASLLRHEHGASYLELLLTSHITMVVNEWVCCQTGRDHTLLELISKYVESWKEREHRLEVEQKEKESVYVSKGTPSDEELLQQAQDKLFPTFHKDFDEDGVMEDKTVNILERDLSIDKLHQMCQLHAEVVRHRLAGSWLPPFKQPIVETDFLHPLLTRYTIKQNLPIELSPEADKQLLPGLLVLTASNGTLGFNEWHLYKNTQLKDFYKDDNVEEVTRGLHILGKLEEKILELLTQFPEQPALLQVKKILDRIYEFSITSPLMRFVTGFQFVLQACEDWESVAHSGVSLSNHLESIRRLIIDWRTMELQGWRQCFENIHHKIKVDTAKWWSRLWCLITQFMTATDDTVISMVTLMQTLNLFIEDTSLEEFDHRLHMLLTFHCHLFYYPDSEKRDDLAVALFNLHAFYKQYSSAVNDKKKHLLAPIETKLKEFVKIVKWESINTWSLKQTVDKSHRTLVKHIKQYEEILNSKVDLLSLEPSIVKPTQTKSKKKRNFRKHAELFILPEEDLSNCNVLQRTSHYHKKTHQLCNTVFENVWYNQLIEGIEEMTKQIIEDTQHLRSLSVDRTLDKDKQKAQIKSTQQHKKLALTELFRALYKLGINHKTGLWFKANSPLYFSEVPLASSNEIQDCDRSFYDYFWNSATRLIVLENCLQSPSKELGPQILERLRGYSQHLMELNKTQLLILCKTQSLRKRFNKYSQMILKLQDTKLELLNQTELLRKRTMLHELLNDVIYTLKQFEMILDSWPEEVNKNESYLCIEHIPDIMLSGKNSDYYQQVRKQFENISSRFISLQTRTIPEVPTWLIVIKTDKVSFFQDDVTVFNNYDLQLVDKTLETFQETMIDLVKFRKLFQEYPLYNPFVACLVSLEDRCENKCRQFSSVDCQLLQENVDISHEKKQADSLIQDILIVVQKLYKKYEVKVPANVEGSFIENHLKEKIIEELTNDLQALNLENINSTLNSLLSCLNIAAKRNELQKTKELQRLLLTALPFIQQLEDIIDFFIEHQESSLRSSAKLLSVILTTFTDLAKNGFCTPPDLEEDGEGDGGKQSSGFGLGDGEGQTDVSERIESEDQLDEAKPQGQEKDKEEDKDCKEEEKGIDMSEDFEGDAQDLDKKDDEENEEDNEKNDEEEPDDKEMGETGEDADRLDEELWNSDDEEGEGKDDKDDGQGKGETKNRNEYAAGEEQGEENQDEGDNREKEKEDINEMQDPEYNEDQVDPYHGNHPPEVEPEAFDLPDNMQLDDGEDKEKEGEGEDPFDVDQMKEPQEPDVDMTEETEKKVEEETTENVNTSDEESDEEDKNKQKEGDEKEQGDDREEESKEDGENKEEPSLNDQVAKPSEDRPSDVPVQPAPQVMGAKDSGSTDEVEAGNEEKEPANETTEKTAEGETKGAGKADTRDVKQGHKSQDSKKQTVAKEETGKKKKRDKPGRSNEERTLGDFREPVEKKLKTIEEAEDIGGDEETMDLEGDVQQHVKDAKKSDKQVMDAATEEQAEQQRASEKGEAKPNEDEDIAMDVDDDEETVDDVQKQKSEKVVDSNDKEKNKKLSLEAGDKEDLDGMEIEIEGETVLTSTVLRGPETTFHTRPELIGSELSSSASLLPDNVEQIRQEIQDQLAALNVGDSVIAASSAQAWQLIIAAVDSLSRELSEQLRLVLEPTVRSRLKGDYRTGKRLNMRKVISYLASDFRKDRIWLRRTKPWKRDHRILLAIDDSSSMSDNQSKELAFESLALVSKALTFLEAGELSVLSFGEKTKIIHGLGDPFSDDTGAKLIEEFTFQQHKTYYSEMLELATTMLTEDSRTRSTDTAELIVIVSDGRGVFSEGEEKVQRAVRRACDKGIFIVFLIVDNPQMKDSIMDIRRPQFKMDGRIEMSSYMEQFPFPYYLILKDITMLPNVLCDALRQWFQLVNSDVS